MALQLVVYPQRAIQGFSTDIDTDTQIATDGQVFATVNQAPILTPFNSFMLGLSWGTLDIPVNSWRKYNSDGTDTITASDNKVTFGSADNEGLAQSLSQLEVGINYSLEINLEAGTMTAFMFYYDEGRGFQYFAEETGIDGASMIAGTNTLTFRAAAPEMQVIILSTTIDTILTNFSVQGSVVAPSGAIGVLYSEKVICDLYSEESIPLVLSATLF